MKIAYLWDGTGSGGARVAGQQAAVLAGRGHEVLALAEGEKPEGLAPGVVFHRVPALGSAPALELLAGCEAVVATAPAQVPVALDAGLAAPFLLVGSPQEDGRAGWGEGASGEGLLVALLPAEAGDEELEELLAEGVTRHRERMPAAPTLGLAMIVRDEEENLRRCLPGARPLVQEIVVVDTGSRDGSREVAAEWGARVVEYPWQGDFAQARNVALDHLTTDWVLVLDADERLAGDYLRVIPRAIRNPFVAGYLLEIVNFLGDNLISGAATHASVRLFRRLPGYRYEGPIHEQISHAIVASRGRIRPLPGVSVLHYGYLGQLVEAQDKEERNLGILRRRVAEDPRDSFAHFNLGVEHMRRRELGQAIKAFQRAFRLLPGPETPYAPPLLRHLAACLLDSGRTEEALAVLEQGEALYPEYVDLAYLRGVALNRMGRFAEALAVLEDCLRRGDTSAVCLSQVGAGSFLARLAMVDSYLALGRMEEVAEAYRLGKEEAQRRLGEIHASRGEDEAGQNRAGSDWLRGEALLREGDLKGAVEAYRRALAPEVRKWWLPSQLPFLWARRMVLELAAGEEGQAGEAVAALQGVDRRRAAACRALLGLWARGGVEEDRELARARWDDYLTCLETALDLGRQEWFARAVEWLSRGRLDTGELELGLGKLFFRRGLQEAAAERLLAAARVGRADAEAWWMLGEIGQQRGWGPEARSFYRQAVRLAPNSARYWLALARSYHAQGAERAGLRVLAVARRRGGGELVHAASMALELSLRVKTQASRTAGVEVRVVSTQPAWRCGW